jgi:hypothetical protein
MFYFPFHIWELYGIILPIDFHIFQDGYCTTNQYPNPGIIPWESQNPPVTLTGSPSGAFGESLAGLATEADGGFERRESANG